MAGLRSNRAMNRTNRGIVDHDIMEGLPVRQWRKQPATVNPTPPKEVAPVVTESDPNDRWKELPMPRGSELYSPMSQALLRAARLGRIKQPFSPDGKTAIDEKEANSEKEKKEEQQTGAEPETVITTVKWTQVARDLEQPEMEFLAKRRKGLPSLVEDAGGSTIPMRKVKVRKLDAAGNATVYDAMVPEGQTVDGEIIDGTADIATEAPAPGTVVEGVGIANADGIVVAGDQVMPTPPRRMPPRPKRKMKGPGRGRKKKQMLEPGAEGSTQANADGATATTGEGGEGGLKVPDGGADAASGSDVDMGNESAARDDGDDSDGDEDDDGDDASDAGAGHSRSVSKEPPKSAPAVGEDVTPATTNEAPAPAPPEPTPLDTAAAVAAEQPATDSAALPPLQPPIINSPTLVSPTAPIPAAPLASLLAEPIPASSGPPEDLPMEDAPAPGPVAPEQAVELAEAPALEQPAPEIEAALPADHNPLDGLAEPKPDVEMSNDASTSVEQEPSMLPVEPPVDVPGPAPPTLPPIETAETAEPPQETDVPVVEPAPQEPKEDIPSEEKPAETVSMPAQAEEAKE